MADIPQVAVDDFIEASGIISDVAHSHADTVPTKNGPLRTMYKMQTDFQEQVDDLLPNLAAKEDKSAKNAPNGFPGLIDRDVAIYEATGTKVTKLHSVATAPRELSLPDKSGTLATSDDVTAILDLVGDANGIAPLDNTGKIAAIYLPGFVDDVLEYANLAALPVNGESGKIYITTDNNKQFRWSGSVYVELVAAPGSTDAVPEGTNNKYFSVARVLASALTGLSTVTSSAITASDTVLSAFGKVQAQLNTLITNNTGTNTGDETAATIKSKLAISTLSGSNTGDETNTTLLAKLAVSGVLDANQKGAANGLAPLGADSKIAAMYLPSYVDDVLEFTNQAAFPATGESGKIYVANDTNITYRWSGTVYIALVSSPGSTDAVPEGATNKYFTEARVRATVLTGLSLASSAAVSAADSFLSAIGKLQKQYNDLAAANTGTNTGDETATTLKTKLGVTNVVDTASIGQANGIVPLGSDTKIAAIYLPSFVDDVLEYATQAAFPATGETGKIYVSLATNATFRWSGSAYIQLVASPGSTDAVVEGSVNLYFTGARVLASVLTGLTAGTNAAIAATDSILTAMGKLQNQITSILALKDATGGFVGLTLFKINFKNAANTFTSFLTNSNTAARTYTFPDYDATMATQAGTETLSGKTLSNPTILNFTEAGQAPAAGNNFTVNLANGTDFEFTTNANATIALPAAAPGKSYTITVIYGGAHNVTFTGGTLINSPNNVLPLPTSVAGKRDFYSCKCDRQGTMTTISDAGRNI